MDNCLSSLKVFNKVLGRYYAEKFWQDPTPQKEIKISLSHFETYLFSRVSKRLCSSRSPSRNSCSWNVFQLTSISFRYLNRKIDRAKIGQGDISEDFFRSLNLAFSKIMYLISSIRVTFFDDLLGKTYLFLKSQVSFFASDRWRARITETEFWNDFHR